MALLLTQPQWLRDKLRSKTIAILVNKALSSWQSKQLGSAVFHFLPPTQNDPLNTSSKSRRQGWGLTFKSFQGRWEKEEHRPRNSTWAIFQKLHISEVWGNWKQPNREPLSSTSPHPSTVQSITDTNSSQAGQIQRSNTCWQRKGGGVSMSAWGKLGNLIDSCQFLLLPCCQLQVHRSTEDAIPSQPRPEVLWRKRQSESYFCVISVSPVPDTK